MIRTFRLFRIASSTATLYLTRPAQAHLSLGLTGLVTVAHGARRTQAQVTPLEDTGDLLPVAAQVADALGLVDGLPYQLRFAGGELRIGPVIGILAARTSDQIDLDLGGLARQFVLRYPETGGLVYLFGAEDVDLASETVRGFRWTPGQSDDPAVTTNAEWERARKLSARVCTRADDDAPPATPHPRSARFQAMAATFLAETPCPEAGGGWHGPAALGQGRFVEGLFPLPGAIWRRAGFLSQAVVDRLIHRGGPTIFNSSFFNKEEGYALLTADSRIRPYLPATEPLTGLGQVFEWLGRGGAVMLKQIEGNSGYGLMRLERTSEGYLLRFRESLRAESYPARPELEQRLGALIRGGRYLLQQWIDLPDYEGRLVDYRVMMQKDDRGFWHPACVVGRFGQRGAILTNFINDGYALPPDESLQRAFSVGRREAYALKRELLRFADVVCRALDRTGGCYGDLGLDIGLDRRRQPWLFEVNKLPFLELPLHMGDEQGYLAAKSGPLLFAARLAGFGR